MHKHPEPQAAGHSKPFLKWAGGKSRVLQHIIPRLPTGRRLIEPFVGGGAIFLGTQFDEYLLGDSNAHLIELYRAVADDPDAFIRKASTYFTEENRSSERYVELRRLFNSEADGLEQAALFLYLNKFGFNGLCRYNRSGRFNTPYGHLERVPRFPTNDIVAFAAKARRAEILNEDFATVMRKAVPGDVVYCDPPYLDKDDAVSFTAYGAHGFGIERQRELAILARELAARGIPVAVSNHDCAAAREMYCGAEIYSFDARRSISAAGDKRGQVGELLAIFR